MNPAPSARSLDAALRVNTFVLITTIQQPLSSTAVTTMARVTLIHVFTGDTDNDVHINCILLVISIPTYLAVMGAEVE